MHTIPFNMKEAYTELYLYLFIIPILRKPYEELLLTQIQK